MTVRKMKRGSLLALCSLCAMLAAHGETNLVSEVARRTHVKAYSDVETAYWARGAIADKKSYVAQFADLTFDLDPFGRIGGYVWCASALATSGQSYTRRNAYNEFNYAVYYGYGLELAEDWTLETTIVKKWVVLPGYRPHLHSFSEWDISQSLKNPYVTPYYLMRRAYHGQQWCYWEVGLTRSWMFLDDFTFTATFFGDLGDSRHFATQYGANPHGGRYSDGLMALNLILRLDYAVTENFGIFAFVHQFDVVSSDARAALGASSRPETVKDITIGCIGVELNF